MKTKSIITLCALAINFSLFADVEYPILKEGQWDMTMKYETAPAGMPASMMQDIKMTQCVDAASQKNLIENAQQNSACDKPVITKNGDTYLIDMKCNHEGRSMTMHTETSFVGDSGIKSRVVMKGDQMPEMVMLTTGKHTGACPADMKPGDAQMVGPNGMKIPMNKAAQ